MNNNKSVDSSKEFLNKAAPNNFKGRKTDVTEGLFIGSMASHAEDLKNKKPKHLNIKNSPNPKEEREISLDELKREAKNFKIPTTIENPPQIYIDLGLVVNNEYSKETLKYLVFFKSVQDSMQLMSFKEVSEALLALSQSLKIFVISEYEEGILFQSQDKNMTPEKIANIIKIAEDLSAFPHPGNNRVALVLSITDEGDPDGIVEDLDRSSLFTFTDSPNESNIIKRGYRKIDTTIKNQGGIFLSAHHIHPVKDLEKNQEPILTDNNYEVLGYQALKAKLGYAKKNDVIDPETSIDKDLEDAIKESNTGLDNSALEKPKIDHVSIQAEIQSILTHGSLLIKRKIQDSFFEYQPGFPYDKHNIFYYIDEKGTYELYLVRYDISPNSTAAKPDIKHFEKIWDDKIYKEFYDALAKSDLTLEEFNDKVKENFDKVNDLIKQVLPNLSDVTKVKSENLLKRNFIFELKNTNNVEIFGNYTKNLNVDFKKGAITIKIENSSIIDIGNGDQKIDSGEINIYLIHDQKLDNGDNVLHGKLVFLNENRQKHTVTDSEGNIDYSWSTSDDYNQMPHRKTVEIEIKATENTSTNNIDKIIKTQNNFTIS